MRFFSTWKTVGVFCCCCCCWLCSLIWSIFRVILIHSKRFSCPSLSLRAHSLFVFIPFSLTLDRFNKHTHTEPALLAYVSSLLLVTTTKNHLVWFCSTFAAHFSLLWPTAAAASSYFAACHPLLNWIIMFSIGWLFFYSLCTCAVCASEHSDDDSNRFSTWCVWLAVWPWDTCSIHFILCQVDINLETNYL